LLRLDDGARALAPLPLIFGHMRDMCAVGEGEKEGREGDREERGKVGEADVCQRVKVDLIQRQK